MRISMNYRGLLHTIKDQKKEEPHNLPFPPALRFPLVNGIPHIQDYIYRYVTHVCKAVAFVQASPPCFLSQQFQATHL